MGHFDFESYEINNDEQQNITLNDGTTGTMVGNSSSNMPEVSPSVS